MKMPSTSKVAIPVHRGLPALVDGAACMDPAQMSHFVALLRKVRTKMAGDWADACSKARRQATVVRAVDDLISFVLLTEYVRQRDRDALPCLKDILSAARPLSARRLFTTAKKTTRSKLLRAVFAVRNPVSGLSIPKSLRVDELCAGLVRGIHRAFPSGMPVSAFGTFRLLSFEDPILAGRACAAPRRRVSPERHAKGIYYTPPALADYLTHTSLGHALEQSHYTPLGIRVLDPACGCGVFLIAVLRLLIAWLVRGERANDTHRRHIRNKTGMHKNQHLRTLLQSLGSTIQGVDTDGQALEWTRRCLYLTFWESTRWFTLANSHTSPLVAPDFGKALTQLDFLDAEGRARGRRRLRLFDRFDVVLGAPPFLRIEEVHSQQSDHLPEYRRMFRTARAGQFDLYMLFVERAIRLLKPGGTLGFSMSGSFLRSRTGKALRDILGREGRVSEIVEFESRNIYPDCTSHVCLLSFQKGRTPRSPRYATVKSSTDVRATLARFRRRRGSVRGVESHQPRIDFADSDVWRLEPSRDARLLARLERTGTALADLPIAINLGICTGADDVFVLRRMSSAAGDLLRAERTVAREEHVLEVAATRPLLRGRDLAGYTKPKPQWVCVCPGDYEGVSPVEHDIRAMYPRAFAYLKDHRKVLLRLAAYTRRPWYTLKRPARPCVRRRDILLSGLIASEGSFTIGCLRNVLCHQSALRISPVPDWIDPYYLLGALNSRAIWTFIRHRMPAVGAGRHALRTGQLKKLPIPLPKSPEEAKQCRRIARLARYLMLENREARVRWCWRKEINTRVLALLRLDSSN